jgi:deaminated glutathione amidase
VLEKYSEVSVSPAEKISVSVVSVTATPDKKANLDNVFAKAEQAVRDGASWVALPEMFAFHGPYTELWENAEFERGPLNDRLSEFARRHSIVLFAGSAAERPEASTSGKVYNTQYVFGRNGESIAKYRKTHLFNLKDATGKPLYCESDGYLAGDTCSTVSIDGWKVGLATCYDLRFTGFFEALTKSAPLDCIVIPSAFTYQTGMYHWELLLRARAVENLCYVVAPNQVGIHSPGKQSFGHAMIIDPWGTKLADTGHLQGSVNSTMTRERIQVCRGQLPALNNKRPELYL